jgi:hypothetical protein
MTGVFLATVMFVGLGIWLGNLVGRRRRTWPLPKSPSPGEQVACAS